MPTRSSRRSCQVAESASCRHVTHRKSNDTSRENPRKHGIAAHRRRDIAGSPAGGRGHRGRVRLDRPDRRRRARARRVLAVRPGLAAADAGELAPGRRLQPHSEQHTITHGLQHYSETYDTVGGRQHTQVLTADLTDPNLRVGVVEAGDTITDPADETVSSMANRTHAVAGVNGDYFEINGSGRPLGGVITNGKLLKSPKPGFASQLGVRPDGTMVMGPETFTGTITDGSASRALTSVNTVNDVAAGGITEVTSDLGARPGLTGRHPGARPHHATGAFTVDSVQTGVTSRAAADHGPDRSARRRRGRPVAVRHPARGRHRSGLTTQLSPDNDLTQLVSGVDHAGQGRQGLQGPDRHPAERRQPGDRRRHQQGRQARHRRRHRRPGRRHHAPSVSPPTRPPATWSPTAPTPPCSSTAAVPPTMVSPRPRRRPGHRRQHAVRPAGQHRTPGRQRHLLLLHRQEGPARPPRSS